MKTEIKEEMIFFYKVVRNAVILGVLYFASLWAVGTVTWAVVKPVILFLLTYTCLELAKHYKIDIPNNWNNKKAQSKTLIFA